MIWAIQINLKHMLYKEKFNLVMTETLAQIVLVKLKDSLKLS